MQLNFTKIITKQGSTMLSCEELFLSLFRMQIIRKLFSEKKKYFKNECNKTVAPPSQLKRIVMIFMKKEIDNLPMFYTYIFQNIT